MIFKHHLLTFAVLPKKLKDIMHVRTFSRVTTCMHVGMSARCYLCFEVNVVRQSAEPDFQELAGGLQAFLHVKANNPQVLPI